MFKHAQDLVSEVRQLKSFPPQEIKGFDMFRYSLTVVNISLDPTTVFAPDSISEGFRYITSIVNGLNK